MSWVIINSLFANRFPHLKWKNSLTRRVFTLFAEVRQIVWKQRERLTAQCSNHTSVPKKSSLPRKSVCICRAECLQCQQLKISVWPWCLNVKKRRYVNRKCSNGWANLWTNCQHQIRLAAQVCRQTENLKVQGCLCPLRRGHYLGPKGTL